MTRKDEIIDQIYNLEKELFKEGAKSAANIADGDPKYMNIPNICFSCTDADDKREMEFSKQRIERGFDDSETWALDFTIASFILPRLKRFKEVTNGVPGNLSEEEWDNILDIMIKAFEFKTNEYNNFDLTLEEEKQIEEKIQEGLNLFAKWFVHLWW